MYGPFLRRAPKKPRRRKFVHPAVRAARNRKANIRRKQRERARAMGLLPPTKRRRRKKASRSSGMRVSSARGSTASVTTSATLYDFTLVTASVNPPSPPPLRGRARPQALPRERMNGARSYPFMKLAAVKKLLPLARRHGVAEGATGPGGFVEAFVKAKGKAADLSASWKKKRNAFLRAQLAAAKEKRERLSLKKGRITRRSIALAMWAYSKK